MIYGGEPNLILRATRENNKKIKTEIKKRRHEIKKIEEEERGLKREKNALVSSINYIKLDIKKGNYKKRPGALTEEQKKEKRKEYNKKKRAEKAEKVIRGMLHI